MRKVHHHHRAFKMIRRVHPIIKIILYVHVACLSLLAPLESVVLLSCALFISLVVWPRPHTFAASPWFAMAICGIPIIIALPFDVAGLSGVALSSLRLFSIVTGSAVLCSVSSPLDFLRAARQLRFPSCVRFTIGVSARFVPIAVEEMQNVLVAQQSRGLRLSLRAFASPITYRALIVPYIVSILRAAERVWLAASLRPLDAVPDKVPSTLVSQMAGPIILVTSSLLWIPWWSFLEVIL